MMSISTVGLLFWQTTLSDAASFSVVRPAMKCLLLRQAEAYGTDKETWSFTFSASGIVETAKNVSHAWEANLWPFSWTYH